MRDRSRQSPPGCRTTRRRLPPRFSSAALLRLTCALWLALPLAACAPTMKAPAPPRLESRLAPAHFVATDGAVLPMRRWLPESAPARAVVVALHGFNDYSRAFEMPGEFFRRHGIACYAYDQRGFGQAPDRGFWAGTPAYTGDLAEFTSAVRRNHPGLPVYLLGESMGAAVAIAAMTRPHPPPADGLILSAPAVWSRSTMPWYQRVILETTARTVPWLTLTGEGMDVIASDNIAMLRGLGRDPWVIKATRVDAIYGLVDLMDEAMARVGLLRTPTLVLVGEHDQIIPKEPLQRMLEKLPRPPARVVTYRDGYHLLLRDLQAERPWRDIVAWVGERFQPLPPGAARQIAAAPVEPARGLE